jgi:membrane protein DedA with SNARE-associated domain
MYDGGMPDLLHWISTYGVAALAVLLMLGVFGLPVPDETLLTFAGVLIREGELHFATTWTAAALGSMCGITISYGLGRWFGPAAVSRFGRWFHINQTDLVRVEGWLERRGKWTLTFGYFIPGVRHVTALIAGSSQLPPRIFAAFAYSGAVIWSLTFIALGWMVGDRWKPVLESVHRHVLTAVMLLMVAGVTYLVVRRRGRVQ